MSCLEKKLKISMSSKTHIKMEQLTPKICPDSGEVEIIIGRRSSNNCNTLHLEECRVLLYKIFHLILTTTSLFPWKRG